MTSDSYVFVSDLFDSPIIENKPQVDPALTVHGLISHGSQRFPQEWHAVLGNPVARWRLMQAFERMDFGTGKNGKPLKDAYARRMLRALSTFSEAA